MDFDPQQYKQTTRQQWEDAAEAWDRWEPVLDAWLAEATTAMLDGAGVGRGSRVLDVAAGAGGQSTDAARRAGTEGRVLATDISPTILTYAEKRAGELGVHVETAEVDGESLHELGPDAHGGFDAVVSRLGLIYLPDQAGALAGFRRALSERGRTSVVVYSTPERNGFFSGPVSVIRRRAGLPAPGPGLPGPFSLGGPGVLAAALETAGFSDISVEALDAPLHMSTAAECLRFEKESFGALHQMLAGVPVEEREDVWAEVEETLNQYETSTGFVGPCELLVGSASR